MNAKKIIMEAAFSLFESTPFERITVQQILDRAEVSRGTFYKYFKDKYELMTLYYKQFADENTKTLFDGHNIEVSMYELLSFIEENRYYFLHVKEIEGQNSFVGFLRKYSMNFYGSIKCHNEKRTYLTEEEELVLYLFIEGSIQLVKRFIDGNISIEKKELSRLMFSLLPVSYKELLHEEYPFQYQPFSY